jgi:Rps23 Pro-64 3,4-dihydroxylase Tpa1-like proline 4-hydroxylase
VNPDRQLLARRLSDVLSARAADLQRQWAGSGPINHFVLDDVFPDEWAHAIRRAFPRPEQMRLKRTLREVKCVGAQMDRYNPLLEEAVYAFQMLDVVRIVERITALDAVEPDEVLYAGGVSLMAPGHFLNPHVDNSHDQARERYRVLNLLYYVSPDWTDACGGNLELWPAGLTAPPVTVTSRFNRLVVMVTHQASWHSVSRNLAHADRCCVSNYYYSKHPVGGQPYFHVTSFRGRPEQRIRDFVLRGDFRLRTALRKLFPSGVRENPHFYKRFPPAR